jgi:hypothetical protein
LARLDRAAGGIAGTAGRAAYDEAALIRALGEGIDPAGRTPGQSMPRFRLTPPQATALIDYLRIVGTAADLDPGVSGADFGKVAVDLAGRPGKWLLAGAAEALAPEAATDERLRLVLPIGPGDARSGEASNAPPMAIAATAVLIEGLKRMGARASRAGLIAAVETLRDFPTGVLPPLTFARAAHTGSFASVVIRPDARGGMVMLGSWRTPR